MSRLVRRMKFETAEFHEYCASVPWRVGPEVMIVQFF